MSGADLEYQAMLARAGVNPTASAGYDAARLEQMRDDRDASGAVFADLAEVKGVNDSASKYIVNLAAQHLDSIMAWMSANNASMICTETGVPSPLTPSGEAARWRSIGYAQMEMLASRNIPTFLWSARKAPRPDDILDPYKSSRGFTGSFDIRLAQAATYEKAPAYMRGICASDGHLGFATTAATGGFNNSNRGVFNTDYTYLTLADYYYLASRGYENVRLTVRWERIQPTLGAALDVTELARVTESVEAAKSAGLGILLSIKNHGAYYVNVAGTSTRTILGEVGGPTQAQFVDLWTRLSTAFKSHTNIYGYDLDNEPVLPTVANWHAASQAAVTAIRNNGDNHLIAVQGGGAGYSFVASWVQDNGPVGWITDPSNNFVYAPNFYPYGQYQNTTDYVSLNTLSIEASSKLQITERAKGVQQLDAAFQTMPIPTGNATPTTGRLYIAYWDAHMDLLITKLEGYSGTAGAGLTLGRISLGIVNSSGDVKVLAETASSPSSWQSTNSFITLSLSTARAGASSVRIVKGQRYASLLLLTGTTMPTISGATFTLTAMAGQLPKLAMRLNSQTDITAPGNSILAADMAQAELRPYLLAKP